MRDLQLQCEANVRELHQLQVSSRSQKAELVVEAAPAAPVAGFKEVIGTHSKLHMAWEDPRT